MSPTRDEASDSAEATEEKILHFRLPHSEAERLLRLARREGFRNVASFVRSHFIKHLGRLSDAAD